MRRPRRAELWPLVTSGGQEATLQSQGTEACHAPGGMCRGLTGLQPAVSHAGATTGTTPSSLPTASPKVWGAEMGDLLVGSLGMSSLKQEPPGFVM